MGILDLPFFQGRITNDPQDGPGYPDMGLEALNKGHRKIIKKLIKQDDKVVDAGCGVGRIASWFKNYTGFDFVPEFIEAAKTLQPDKKFVVADYNQKLPFADKEFDWCIIISAYQYVDDDAELRRIAKKILILSYGNKKSWRMIG